MFNILPEFFMLYNLTQVSGHYDIILKQLELNKGMLFI
jgi:hypothetical protein